ncbi:MAG TPA: EVE domain-containing protein [Longimicrobiales bacterium]
MPSYWIVKTEPSSYSFDDLEREKRTVWDGVKNAVALKNIRAMKKGDAVMVYHTGDEKQIVGLATVVSDPYPDPKAGDEALVVVDVEVGKRLPRPVTLAQIKADPDFKDFALVRQGRLSVVPVEERLWKKLLRMGGA